MSQKPNSTNRLQPDAINFSSLARNHLAQFAAAAAKGYKPVDHSQPSGAASSTTTTTTASSSAGATGSTPSTPVSSSTASSATSAVTTVNPGGSASAAAHQPTTTNSFGASSLQPGGAQSNQNKNDKPVHSTPFKGPQVVQFDLNKFNGCKFVLLDQYVLELADNYEQVSGTYQWEICQDQIDRCEKFIKEDSADRRVFLVTSGGLGAQIIKRIHDLPQLYAVYVHCVDVPSHMKWTASYPKVRMVCDNDKNFLIPQLALDVAQSNLEWAVELLKKGDKDKATKKLEHAMKVVEKFMEPSPNPELKKEIQRKQEECK